MISFKPYLRGEKDADSETTYRRIIALFLEAIATHSVEGELADHERFREEIGKIEKSLTPDTSMSDLLLLSGGVVQAMQDHNERTSKFIRRQSSELQHMVSMLTKTVISIGDSSKQSVGRLQDIEKAIDRTRAVEDIQVLKARLGECLEAVRDETLRQKHEGQERLEALQRELDSSQEQKESFHLLPETDRATGLPGKGEAERAIQLALTSPGGKYLLVAVCSRVQAVNARFGYAVGDRVLAAFAEHFKKGLSPQDQVFRWQGPAIVAVLERPLRIDRVRYEVRQFADQKLERTMELGQRSVLIPIAASWSVFPVLPPFDTTMRQIEAFTAAQVPRDYV